jgi:hypothetical protein
MAGFGLARYLIAGTAFVRVHASVIRAKFTPLCSSTLSARLAFDQVSRRTASLPERARAVAFLDVFRPIAVEPSPSASTCRPA